jgi:hypothetical protein
MEATYLLTILCINLIMTQLNHVLLECWISCALYPLNDSNNIQEKDSKVCQGK